MKGRKLYVGNLSQSITNNELEELFDNYGDVEKVNIIEGKGFGFVEMYSRSEADRAKQALDGSELKEPTLKVNQARPPRGGRRRGYRRYYPN
ncbi:MAG: RNA-binding protein [Deltaproteobacteria bacterium]|nr:RNA-binding protein [Deltaproteobacteria bacterium]MBW1794668.1 RNA-binding protein [Deltaproteobacteria bacterium]MBW2330348.1 RNA-binding protein [Deltaproteobacteria bacterium]